MESKAMFAIKPHQVFKEVTKELLGPAIMGQNRLPLMKTLVLDP
jgi:hypothetical protein